MPLTIQLRPSERQTAFNLKRWRELLADPDLARLPHRIETDRHGHILMRPPPAPAHGGLARYAWILASLSSALSRLPKGGQDDQLSPGNDRIHLYCTRLMKS